MDNYRVRSPRNNNWWSPSLSQCAWWVAPAGENKARSLLGELNLKFHAGDKAQTCALDENISWFGWDYFRRAIKNLKTWEIALLPKQTAIKASPLCVMSLVFLRARKIRAIKVTGAATTQAGTPPLFCVCALCVSHLSLSFSRFQRHGDINRIRQHTGRREKKNVSSVVNFNKQRRFWPLHMQICLAARRGNQNLWFETDQNRFCRGTPRAC